MTRRRIAYPYRVAEARFPYHWWGAVRDGGAALVSRRGSRNTAVFANALPKAGTFLIHATLRAIGGWEDTGLHAYLHGYTDDHGDEPGVVRPVHAGRFLRRIRNGQMLRGHCFHHRCLDRLLARPSRNRRLRHVFLVRDPRSLICSFTRFATHADQFPMNEEFRQWQDTLRHECRDEAERIHFIIQRRHRMYDLRHYVAWLNAPNTTIVRFEDLHEDLALAGRDQVLGQTITGLLRDLDVRPEEVNPRTLHEEAFGNSPTSMRASFPKPSDYRDSFDETHVAALNTPEFRSYVQRLGYAW